MKMATDCPVCGSLHLKILTAARNDGIDTPDFLQCKDCQRVFSEHAVLRHMQEKPGVDPNAPAFRVLNKPQRGKGRSEAARAVFGA